MSTGKQAEHGVSLEAQAQKIRAVAVVHDADLLDVIVDGCESAKSLQRPGMERLLAMVEARQVQAVIVAKLDRLTRSVKDLCELLERFERRSVALISVAESLDTSSAAGRLVINIMTAVSQWEREAIGERRRNLNELLSEIGLSADLLLRRSRCKLAESVSADSCSSGC